MNGQEITQERLKMACYPQESLPGGRGFVGLSLAYFVKKGQLLGGVDT